MTITATITDHELRITGQPQERPGFRGADTAREAARPPEGRTLRGVLEGSFFFLWRVPFSLEGETLASRRPGGSESRESHPLAKASIIGVKPDKVRDKARDKVSGESPLSAAAGGGDFIGAKLAETPTGLSRG